MSLFNKSRDQTTTFEDLRRSLTSQDCEISTQPRQLPEEALKDDSAYADSMTIVDPSSNSFAQPIFKALNAPEINESVGELKTTFECKTPVKEDLSLT